MRVYSGSGLRDVFGLIINGLFVLVVKGLFVLRVEGSFVLRVEGFIQAQASFIRAFIRAQGQGLIGCRE